MTNLISRDGFYVKVSKTHHLSMDEVFNNVVSVSGINSRLLLGQNRKAEIVVWRHIGMYIMYRLGSFTFSEIGRYWGNRNHSSILHAKESIQGYIDINDSFVVKKLDSLAFDYKNVNRTKQNYSAKRYAKA